MFDHNMHLVINCPIKFIYNTMIPPYVKSKINSIKMCFWLYMGEIRVFQTWYSDKKCYPIDRQLL